MIFEADRIKVEAKSVQCHTVGHTVYIVDNKLLISGDCIVINERGLTFATYKPMLEKLRAYLASGDLANVDYYN